MSKKLLMSGVFLFTSLFVIQVFAQDDVLQPTHIIDYHTAGMLPRGFFSVGCYSYPNGSELITGSGITLNIMAGLTDRLNIGVGYGGDGIIGRELPHFNPHIGALFKYRILEESYYLPALAIGYDHQGYGGIDASYNGYIYKSPGFFLALSKNYLVFTKLEIGMHGGINYSLEEYQTVKWPNGYIGMDLGINEEFSLATEYDMATNEMDPGTDSSNAKYANPLYGFLNISAKWNINKMFCMEFIFKDLLRNKVDVAGNRVGWGRELRITYFGKIF